MYTSGPRAAVGEFHGGPPTPGTQLAASCSYIARLDACIHTFCTTANIQRRGCSRVQHGITEARRDMISGRLSRLTNSRFTRSTECSQATGQGGLSLGSVCASSQSAQVGQSKSPRCHFVGTPDFNLHCLMDTLRSYDQPPSSRVQLRPTTLEHAVAIASAYAEWAGQPGSLRRGVRNVTAWRWACERCSFPPCSLCPLRISVLVTDRTPEQALPEHDTARAITEVAVPEDRGALDSNERSGQCMDVALSVATRCERASTTPKGFRGDRLNLRSHILTTRGERSNSRSAGLLQYRRANS